VNPAPTVEAFVRSASRAELELFSIDLARFVKMVDLRLTAREEDSYVDVDEAARLTGLSRPTLYRKPLPFRRPGRPVRFSRRGIEAWNQRREA